MALEFEVAIGQVLDAEEISNQILIFELSLSFESRSFEIKIRVGIL